MSKRRVDLLVTNGIVVTVDRGRRTFERGTVAVDDSLIVAVDKSEKVLPLFGADETVDASGMVVCPGFIDTHVHLAEAILRGCGEDIDVATWLRKRIWPLEGQLTAAEAQASAALSLLEMIKSGTTTFLEVKLHERYGLGDIADLVEGTGIRGVLGVLVSETSPFPGAGSAHQGMVGNKERAIKTTVELSGKWRREKREKIDIWFAPRPLGSCSPGTYREIAGFAKELDIGVTIHHSELQEQVALSKRRYGELPTELMRDVGLVGKKVVLAHCTWLQRKEIEIMARTSTSCAHVPSSEMKLGMGVAPVAQMLRSGVNVSLGCNGGANNNTYDMLREASRACCLQRGVTMDTAAVSNMQALEMGTANGARALGLNSKIGSIEAGKKADLILINCAQPHLQPMVDPIAALIHAASGQDVDTVIVDGKVIMKNRIVTTLNEDGVVLNAKKSARNLLDRTGLVKRHYN